MSRTGFPISFVLFFALTLAPALASPTFTTLHAFDSTDGEGPTRAIIQAADGDLYGATSFVGGTFDGNVFTIDPAGNNFNSILTFSATVTVGSNNAVIQASDGFLYGTAEIGGPHGQGMIFKVAPDGSGFTDLFDFNNITDGEEPEGGVIQGSDGAFYGTTELGFSNQGIVFRFAPGMGLAFSTSSA